MTMLIILALLMLVMFWMTSRQRKAQRKTLEFLETLRPGQRVMTASGYIGTVVSIEGEHYTLESVPGGGTTVWVKGAIRKLVDEQPATEAVTGEESDTAASADFVVPDDISRLIDSEPSESAEDTTK